MNKQYSIKTKALSGNYEIVVILILGMYIIIVIEILITLLLVHYNLFRHLYLKEEVYNIELQ